MQSRKLVVLGWIVVGTFVFAAMVGSIDLGSNLQNPIQACEKALPWHPRRDPLVVAKATRHWPPPLVHCEATVIDGPAGGPVTRLDTVTTKNVVVVALIDALTIAMLVRLALLAASARRERRRVRAGAAATA
jgi:hypothetical protein